MRVTAGKVTLSINDTAFQLPDSDSFLSALQPLYKAKPEEERKEIDKVLKGLYKDLGKPVAVKKTKEKTPEQQESAG